MRARTKPSDYLGDSHSVVAVHDYHFSPGHERSPSRSSTGSCRDLSNSTTDPDLSSPISRNGRRHSPKRRVTSISTFSRRETLALFSVRDGRGWHQSRLMPSRQRRAIWNWMLRDAPSVPVRENCLAGVQGRALIYGALNIWASLRIERQNEAKRQNIAVYPSGSVLSPSPGSMDHRQDPDSLELTVGSVTECDALKCR